MSSGSCDFQFSQPAESVRDPKRRLPRVRGTSLRYPRKRNTSRPRGPTRSYAPRQTRANRQSLLLLSRQRLTTVQLWRPKRPGRLMVRLRAQRATPLARRITRLAPRTTPVAPRTTLLVLQGQFTPTTFLLSSAPVRPIQETRSRTRKTSKSRKRFEQSRNRNDSNSSRSRSKSTSGCNKRMRMKLGSNN